MERGDPYDAYRDKRLESGSWQGERYVRKPPQWQVEANKQRYVNEVASKRTKNAMWPDAAVEHGPPKPRREGDPNRQVHRERFE